MYKRLFTGIVAVLFAGILFSGLFSFFSASIQSLQQNLANIAPPSVLAY